MSIFSNWAEWRGLLPAEEETSVKLRKDCRFAALVEDDKGKFYCAVTIGPRGSSRTRIM